MKYQCPQPGKARQKGCPDIVEDGRCLRKEWSGGITYFKERKRDKPIKAVFYCERIRETLREE